MAFHEQFMANFTTAEQSSKLVQIMDSIGTKSEKAILEDLTVQIQRSTDIFSFTSDKIRSWLAAILYKVRNITSATGDVTVTIASSTSPVSFAKGLFLKTSDGKRYQTTNSLYLQNGATGILHVMQGVS